MSATININAEKIQGNLNITSVSATTLVLSGSNITSSWTSYVTSWTSTGTAPSIGDGTITGAYKVIGKTCFLRVRLVFGASTNGGTGQWYFSLPFNASTSSGVQFPCSILDAGVSWYVATVNGQYGGFVDKTAIIGQTSASNTTQALDSTFPFTWGNLDTLQFNGSYEIA